MSSDVGVRGDVGPPTNLHLAPWERFMLLSHAVEDVPAEAAAEVLPLMTDCAMRVVRSLMGHITQAEAYAAIERTRIAIEDARRR